MNWRKNALNLERRRKRIRSRITGTPARPRLNVRKTNKFLYAQIIDDTTGKTLVFKTTRTKDLSVAGKSAKNIEAAKKLGAAVAEAALGKGISAVVFDRGVAIYHGKVKAVADGAREKGLKF
jgi:large subunit ribosomal protein L18